MENETTIRKLYRSQTSRMLAGVCGGVAEYLAVDVTIIRIAWLLASLFNGIGIIAYLVFLLLVPNNPEQVPVEKAAKKNNTNTSLIIGAGLIIIGLMFLFENYFGFFWITDWPIFRYYPFRWNIIWPFLLILFGIWYIWYSQQKEKRASEKGEGGDFAEAVKTFTRIKDQRMVAGVCAGLARYWNIDVNLVRVGAILLTIFTNIWLGIFVYILVVIAIPQE